MDAHDRYDELLGPFLEGRLTRPEHDEMRAHLAVCGRCREEVALLAAGPQALPADATPEVPPGLRERVLSAVRREERTRRRG